MTETEAYDSLGYSAHVVIDNLLCMGVTGPINTPDEVFLQYLRCMGFDVSSYCATRYGNAHISFVLTGKSYATDYVKCNYWVALANEYYRSRFKPCPPEMYVTAKGETNDERAP